MRTFLKEYEPILYIYRPKTKFRDKVDLILPEASVILFTGGRGSLQGWSAYGGSALGRSAYGGELGRTTPLPRSASDEGLVSVEPAVRVLLECFIVLLCFYKILQSLLPFTAKRGL